jgi:hypothetical protein
MINAKLFVPRGVPTHASGGETFSPLQVYLTGIGAPSRNAALVKVNGAGVAVGGAGVGVRVGVMGVGVTGVAVGGICVGVGGG